MPRLSSAAASDAALDALKRRPGYWIDRLKA
jgi:hypothetical protein